MACTALEHVAHHSRGSSNPTERLRKVLDRLRSNRDANGQPILRRMRLPSYCVTVRKAVVTPNKVYLLAPLTETSNRVVRHFSQYADRFMRVQFLDDNMLRLGGSKQTCAELLERVRHALRSGIRVAGRHYEFLAFSSSQLREHGCWFFTPETTPDGMTAAKIRTWMGDFSNIRNVALYAARMGQCFSSTRFVSGLSVADITDIPDVKRNGHCFSDGVGRVSRELAYDVQRALGLKHCPSAFQFRLGGCKGMLSVTDGLSGKQVQIRPSQRKFESQHWNLEAVRVACYTTGYLNRQFIVLLTTQGVKRQVILDRRDQMVSELDRMLEQPDAAIRILLHNHNTCNVAQRLVSLIRVGLMERQDPYVANLLRLFRTTLFNDLKKKAKIQIKDSTMMMGVMDETGLLGVDQIFVQFVDPLEPGRKRIITGRCLVTRHPGLHPGDIRVVTAVDLPALHSMVDCIVFSQHGMRDIPSQCGGGDLDGDEFTQVAHSIALATYCIWDQELLPPEIHPPMDYTAPARTTVPRVTMDRIKEFFVDYIMSDNLGMISNAHLAWADGSPNGARHPNCIQLARLHSCAVDFPKTGAPATMPAELRPLRYPDFMEKSDKPTYRSRTVLGEIYRSTTLDDFSPQMDTCFDERFLVAGYEDYLEDAREVKRDYDATIRDVMRQFEVGTEWEVVSGWVV
ncbi:RNA-dependent RNA polymerase, partial [Thamnocephalis sphaerospora]